MKSSPGPQKNSDCAPLRTAASDESAVGPLPVGSVGTAGVPYWNGLIDRETLLDRAARAETALRERHADVVADPGYPAFHLAPPVGRLNDPNGLVLRDGVFHAFYQYSPLHPEKGVFWRHATSRNLTRWTDAGTAIAPVDWYDRNGCYSGSGIEAPDGTLEFFYTGNVKDDEGNREAYQCLMTSSDGGLTFVKSSENPLIDGPAPGYTAHFRDPDVTRSEDGTGWRMLLGAQREDLTGAVVRYDSADRRHWTFTGELRFDLAETGTLGYMDECPGLLRMTDRTTGREHDVLLFCPQGMDAQGERFNNTDQSGYVVGHLEGTDFTATTAFEELDAGFEFYAPQAFSGTGERVLLVGWMGNPGQDDQPSLAHGWVHLLTSARELVLEDGRLRQVPARELREQLPLRPSGLLDAVAIPGRPSAAKGRAASELTVPEQSVPELDAQRHHRLVLEATVPDGGAVVLSWSGRDGSRLEAVLGAERITVDRSGTHYTDGGSLRMRTLSGGVGGARIDAAARTDSAYGADRAAGTDAAARRHRVEALFDASALELFVDDGACVLTQRAWLGEFSRVALELRGGAEVHRLDVGILDQE